MDGLTDPQLIRRVRAGDFEAYGILFRRHRAAALRSARRLAGPGRAEDICSEAFVRIFDLLRRGKGPDTAFRAYLLTTVRTVHLNAVRASGKETAVSDGDLQNLTDPVVEDPEARFDEEAIARAFRRLPERWQTVLWLTTVLGLPHEDISPILGIGTNAVASLSFRARAGLRQAYLAEHLRETTGPDCARTVELLPPYLRGILTPRRRRVVEAHLERCSRCTVAVEELGDVDRRLGALLAPLALSLFAGGNAAGAGLGSAKVASTLAVVAASVALSLGAITPDDLRLVLDQGSGWPR